MENRPVTLTSEEWERLSEIIDSPFIQHPDKEYLLDRIYRQLLYFPSDIPTPSHFNPHLTQSSTIRKVHLPTMKNVLQRILAPLSTMSSSLLLFAKYLIRKKIGE